jgi:heme-degrading monooxygenase HmoA
MYAVIFTATTKDIDAEYFYVARRMRALAMEEYGCIDFKSVSEGDQEIAVSYWPSLEHIEKWKGDPEHLKAQALGRQRWYSEYKVQVVMIEREYTSTN